MSDKPLGRKNYGSIPHLPNSRLGSSDKQASEGHVRILTESARKGDLIVVSEKLDGSNVGVAKHMGQLIPLTRAGYRAGSSPYEQHHLFEGWVMQNYGRFWDLLEAGERVVGEWLAQAHGTRYQLEHEPFVIFDIIRHNPISSTPDRLPYMDMVFRAEAQGFSVPYEIHFGEALSVDRALALLGTYGRHGAQDPVEGAVWRCINAQGKTDALAKYVRPDKADGCYLPEVSGKEAVWNWRS